MYFCAYSAYSMEYVSLTLAGKCWQEYSTEISVVNVEKCGLFKKTLNPVRLFYKESFCQKIVLFCQFLRIMYPSITLAKDKQLITSTLIMQCPQLVHCSKSHLPPKIKVTTIESVSKFMSEEDKKRKVKWKVNEVILMIR